MSEQRRRRRQQPRPDPHDPRALAARVLAEVLAGEHTLPEAFGIHVPRGLAPRDRAFVRELAWGTARLQPRLDFLVRQHLRDAPRDRDLDVHALLLIGAYQLGWMEVPDHAAVHATVAATAALGKGWARGLVNAVLRRVSEGDPSAPLSVDDAPETAVHCLPEWLLDHLRSAWPEHWEEIVAAGNARPPMTLRAANRSQTLARFAEAGIAAHPGALAEGAVYLEEACDVQALPGFSEGAVSVQDEGAQLAAELLDPRDGERILDACAAPGGKTLHLAQRAPGAHIVAVESEGRRALRISENFARAGLELAPVVAPAQRTTQWWDGEPFDRILIDAPCTATGILRRQPDVRLLRQEEDVARLQGIQRVLLDRLWPLLAPGGTLVYCTCSVLPEEGPMVVQAFCDAHADARISDLSHLVSGAPSPTTVTADPPADPLPDSQPAPPATEHARGSSVLGSGPGVQLLPTAEAHDGFFYARLTRTTS